MKTYFEFIKLLKVKLVEPLPGSRSHRQMSPVSRNKFPYYPDLTRAKHSGVLILFFPIENIPHIVFIRRSVYNGVHSGQISFPGGKYEPGDKNLLETALRETSEEVGVANRQVEVIGKLSRLYIPPSNFLVEPYIGFTGTKPEFTGDPNEVAEIISVNFDEILDTAARQTTQIMSGKHGVDVPCFMVQEHVIWGATSMILNELVDIMKS
nr:CoA pyrophosphatase [Bacteroidota bacterium]